MSPSASFFGEIETVQIGEIYQAAKIKSTLVLFYDKKKMITTSSEKSLQDRTKCVTQYKKRSSQRRHLFADMEIHNDAHGGRGEDTTSHRGCQGVISEHRSDQESASHGPILSVTGIINTFEFNNVLFLSRKQGRVGFPSTHLWQGRLLGRRPRLRPSSADGAGMLGAVSFDATEGFRVSFGAIDAVGLRPAHPRRPDGFELHGGGGIRGGGFGVGGVVQDLGGVRLALQSFFFGGGELVIALVEVIVGVPVGEAAGGGIVFCADHTDVFLVHCRRQ